MSQGNDLPEGWEERHKEFEDFENKFEHCLSASAINTKFHRYFPTLSPLQQIENFLLRFIIFESISN